MKIFNIFKTGLKKTKTSLLRGFERIFSNVDIWDASTYKELEKVLLSADLGVPITLRLVKDIRQRYKTGEIKTSEDVFKITKDYILNIIGSDTVSIQQNENGLTVILMVGVNGSGKTTTTGKLAHLLKKQGKNVMLAACDTFRAAAIEQLQLWGEKIDVPVISSEYGSDPASVAYKAMENAKNQKIDYLIIDTAGRQHTQQNLMSELEKINRVIKKADPNNPAYSWLIVDGSTGTNALMQVRKFCDFCDLNGLCITKLDGSSKGGVVVAIKDEKKLPIYYVGLGEGSDDLQEFNPEWYAKAIFSNKKEGE